MRTAELSGDTIFFDSSPKPKPKLVSFQNQGKLLESINLNVIDDRRLCPKIEQNLLNFLGLWLGDEHGARAAWRGVWAVWFDRVARRVEDAEFAVAREAAKVKVIAVHQCLAARRRLWLCHLDRQPSHVDRPPPKPAHLVLLPHVSSPGLGQGSRRIFFSCHHIFAFYAITLVIFAIFWVAGIGCLIFGVDVGNFGNDTFCRGRERGGRASCCLDSTSKFLLAVCTQVPHFLRTAASFILRATPSCSLQQIRLTPRYIQRPH